MSKIHLKPCPFNCPGERETVMWRDGCDEVWVYAVECRHCECKGPSADSEELAIKFWNMRTGELEPGMLTPIPQIKTFYEPVFKYGPQTEGNRQLVEDRRGFNDRGVVGWIKHPVEMRGDHDS